MKGQTKLGCLIYIGIAVAVLYVGYKFGSVQWNYYSMKDEIDKIAKLAAASPRIDYGLIKREIIKRGDSVGFTIYPEDIDITANENYLVLEVSWEAEIEFPYYTRYIDFFVRAKRNRGL